MEKTAYKENLRTILIDAEIEGEIKCATASSAHELLEYEQEYDSKNAVQGNIYLAQVASIRADLQAAFINYGGTKAGFLPAAELRSHYLKPRRGSKIESLKVKQNILVQVLKQERRNKGITATTYLVLIGRYIVFMPYTENVSGISRHVELPEDRAFLQGVMQEIKNPPGSSIIIRGAAMNRDREAIIKDYAKLYYLLQKIEQESEGTPRLIYSEADLVHRVFRDFCDEKTKEVVVSGAEIYKRALHWKEYYQVLVKLTKHRGKAPLFLHYKLSEQIDALYSNVVKLSSGGHIVISETEALTAIDVNSGRMSHGLSLEETAYKTNAEAATEIARQLVIRGLSGIIIIDFIDMKLYKHVKSIESSIQEALKKDKARLRIGAISNLGLMEISRQWIKQSLMEASSSVCPNCVGTGRVTAGESLINNSLRIISNFLQGKKGVKIEVKAPQEIALNLLNAKRAKIMEFEKRHGSVISINIDNTIVDSRITCQEIEESVIIDQAQILHAAYEPVSDLDRADLYGEEPIKESFTKGFWVLSWLKRMSGKIGGELTEEAKA